MQAHTPFLLSALKGETPLWKVFWLWGVLGAGLLWGFFFAMSHVWRTEAMPPALLIVVMGTLITLHGVYTKAAIVKCRANTGWKPAKYIAPYIGLYYFVFSLLMGWIFIFAGFMR